MRVAVFVVFVSILATASEASPSCMTRTEAHRHFGSAHIYWHGAGHCWDATSTRQHHQVHHVREKSTHHVREKTEHQAKPKIDHPRWHESMSQMLAADEEPVRTSWLDRWVDIEQAAPAQMPAQIMESESEPIITPRSVMMVITVLTLTLAIVEFLIIGMRLAGPPRRWL